MARPARKALSQLLIMKGYDMKPINIYALTRLTNNNSIQKMERQMSARFRFLKIKEWEIEGISKLVGHLMQEKATVNQLGFYYSYQVPKLGKEFDLLRVGSDKIINIELKSDIVSDDKIKKQLVQNRYYLGFLGRSIRSYTYISKVDRLVRLTNSGKLIDVGFDVLMDDIRSLENPLSGDIEELIREEDYIFSPLAEPDRFLNNEYFLTSQQKDIAYRITKNISDGVALFQGFTGAPGTGKTLLLYDLAMSLTVKQSAAIFHCGSFPLELKRLDERLKRIDFFDGTISGPLPDISGYSVIFIDEGHRASKVMMENICEYAICHKIPVIVSYDCEDVIAAEELKRESIYVFESQEGFVKYRMTNRIRTNAELSSFIHCLMHYDKRNHRRYFPSVNILYARDDEEKNIIISSLIDDGYMYIYENDSELTNTLGAEHIDKAVSGEYEKVAMVLDEDFYYDDDYLRSRENHGNRRVVNVFHGLSRGKEALAVVVKNNEELIENILSIVQGN